jgi:serine phosphatase RsbU (regulator of sigma subunit)
MQDNKKKDNSEPRFHDTILNDIRRGDFRSSVSRDFRDMKSFYIDEERKRRLDSMGRFRKFFWMIGLGFKSLYFKLIPARRILLLIALAVFVFTLNSNRIAYDDEGDRVQVHSINLGPAAAFLLVLFILMLELKDKLIARNELEAGRRVQTKMMPESNPVIDGWEVWLYTRPARDVGGDMVDYLEKSPGKYYLAQADVAGKGLGAALFMVKLQATLRALAPDIEDPADIGSKMNEIFYRDSTPKDFASMAYVELAENKGKVEIMNAGHMPPILVHGGRLREIRSRAPALGLMRRFKYGSTTLELNANDLLIIYSDGITEARSDAGGFFGEERLKAIIKNSRNTSANHVGNHIIEAVHRYMGDSPSSDDHSLIILRKK